MKFRKLTDNAKKLNVPFKAVLPVGDDTTFNLTFRLLTGREGMWIYRDNLVSESSTSFSMKVDHRSACASLISLDDGEEVLSPVDIVRILYPEAELADPALAMEKSLEDTERVAMQVLWTSAMKKAAEGVSINDFTLGEKEVVWELLHFGLLKVYEPEFNFAFTNVWIDAYREVRPTSDSIRLKKSIIEVQEAVAAVQAKILEDERASEAEAAAAASVPKPAPVEGEGIEVPNKLEPPTESEISLELTGAPNAENPTSAGS
jgi:hypothetical protein